MLASPIVLYDYPAIAEASPGDLCDAAEIDEILSLRILTLTEEEKREARATDPRARAIIDRGIRADGSRPRGTAYLVSTRDPLRNVRAAGYGDAKAVVRNRVELREVAAPDTGAPADILAYFTGALRVTELQTLTFRPGAAADHLTSSGGVLDESSSGDNAQLTLEEIRAVVNTAHDYGFTVAALQAKAGQEIMLISSSGTLVRTTVDEISVQGRNTQGVRLIRLDEGERLVGIERIESLEGADEGAAAGEGPHSGAGEPANEP